jgi:hypothetical protein
MIEDPGRRGNVRARKDLSFLAENGSMGRKPETPDQRLIRGRNGFSEPALGVSGLSFSAGSIKEGG